MSGVFYSVVANRCQRRKAGGGRGKKTVRGMYVLHTVLYGIAGQQWIAHS